MSIWANLGLGNLVACILCFIYLIKKLSWHQAARKSTAAMSRVQAISMAKVSDNVKKPIDSKKEKLISSQDKHEYDNQNNLVTV